MKLSAPASLAPLVALASLTAATASSGDALPLHARSTLERRTMNYGTLNYTRDYQIEYNATYWDALATADKNATTTFCSMLHYAAVDWAEADNRNDHHVLDCVPSQAGPVIYAFTGGIAKDAEGNYHSGETVVDSTPDVFSNYTAVHAWIVARPDGAAVASGSGSSAVASATGASVAAPAASGADSWLLEVFAKRDIAIERD